MEIIHKIRGHSLTFLFMACMIGTIVIGILFVDHIVKDRYIIQGLCNVSNIVWYSKLRCFRTDGSYYSPNIAGYFIAERNESQISDLLPEEEQNAVKFESLYQDISVKQNIDGVLFHDYNNKESNIDCSKTITLTDSMKELHKVFPLYVVDEKIEKNKSDNWTTELDTWYFNCFYVDTGKIPRAIIYHRTPTEFYYVWILIALIFSTIMLGELIHQFGYNNGLKMLMDVLHKAVVNILKGTLWFISGIFYCVMLSSCFFCCGKKKYEIIDFHDFTRQGCICMPCVYVFKQIYKYTCGRKQVDHDDEEENREECERIRSNSLNFPPVSTQPLSYRAPETTEIQSANDLARFSRRRSLSSDDTEKSDHQSNRSVSPACRCSKSSPYFEERAITPPGRSYSPPPRYSPPASRYSPPTYNQAPPSPQRPSYFSSFNFGGGDSSYSGGGGDYGGGGGGGGGYDSD